IHRYRFSQLSAPVRLTDGAGRTCNGKYGNPTVESALPALVGENDEHATYRDSWSRRSWEIDRRAPARRSVLLAGHRAGQTFLVTWLGASAWGQMGEGAAESGKPAALGHGWGPWSL